MKAMISMLTLIFSLSVFAATTDICGKQAPELGLSQVEAMVIVDKTLVKDFKADKVFYGCENDGTWGLIYKNKFPEIFKLNLAFIFLDSETHDTFKFRILAADERYEFANFATVNKFSKKIEVFTY